MCSRAEPTCWRAMNTTVNRRAAGIRVAFRATQRSRTSANRVDACDLLLLRRTIARAGALHGER